MATPPRVQPAAVDAAAAAIFKRHDEHGDRRLGEMGIEPAEVLAYLQRHAPDFAPGLRCDDLDDVAVLLLGEWWQHQRRMLFWLRQLVKLRASRAEFGAVFGIGPQGVKDWLDRLEELLGETGTGRPDEQAARERRRSAAEEANRPATPEQRWLSDHAREYELVARALLELYMLVDEDTAAMIAEVRRDLDDGEYEPDRLTVLGLAMEALEEADVQIPRSSGVEADQVRTDIRMLLDRYAQLQGRRRDAAGLG